MFRVTKGAIHSCTISWFLCLLVLDFVMKKCECILHWCVFPQNNQNLKGQSEINDSVIFNASSFSFPIQVSFRNYLPVPHTSRVLSSQLHCTYIYLASNVFHYVQCLQTLFWIHWNMPCKLNGFAAWKHRTCEHIDYVIATRYDLKQNRKFIDIFVKNT